VNRLHDFLGAVAAAAGVPPIRLGANGFAELVIQDGLMSFWISTPEEDRVELSARLPAFGEVLHADILRELLAENACRRIGRFALDGNGVVLGQRLDLSAMDESDMVAHAADFLREALHLEASGAQAIMDRARRQQPAHPHSGGGHQPDQTIVRL